MKQMFFNVASLALVCGLAFIHPVTAAGFSIQVVFTSAVSAAANASFQAAVARWQQVITQTSKTRIRIKKGKQVCGQPPAAKDIIVNDLLIFASIVPIDGVGKILGQAGPCGQDGAGINRLGNMQFDIADADALIQAGTFNSVVLHEMGHVLGIGSNWAQKKLVAKQGNTVIYTGKNGIKGQAEIGGTNNPVVEDQGGAGTALVHWKESVYNNELMTGFLNGQTQPLSALTAESLKDLGFAGINVGAADAFTEPGVPTAAPTVAATNAGNGAFKINLVFTSTLTPSQTAAFVNAANRWQSIITAPIGNVVQVPAGTQICGQTLANDLTIKDITIFAAIAPIDGVGKILGQAGPCGFDNNGRVRLGNMQFDVADTNNLEAQGTLTATILHEMGHVLGIGTQWDQNNLISPGNPPLLYQGANGNKGQQEIGGTGQAVVEDIGGAGTARGHWKEAVYDNELMTGFLNGNSQPLSKLTIESLKDLGYQVDVNQADAFTIPTQVGRRLRNLKDKAERAKFMEEMTEKDRDLATQVQWEMPYPVESITWNMPTSDDLLSGDWETGYNGTMATTEDQLVEENKDDNVAALVGGVVGTLAVVGAAAAFVVIRRRRSSKTGMASPLASSGAPAFATHGTQAQFNNHNNMQMSAANPAFGQQMPPFAAYAQPQQPAQFYQPQTGGGYNKQQVGGYQYA